MAAAFCSVVHDQGLMSSLVLFNTASVVGTFSAQGRQFFTCDPGVGPASALGNCAPNAGCIGSTGQSSLHCQHVSLLLSSADAAAVNAAIAAKCGPPRSGQSYGVILDLNDQIYCSSFANCVGQGYSEDICASQSAGAGVGFCYENASCP
jgi:hypothetical protein